MSTHQEGHVPLAPPMWETTAIRKNLLAERREPAGPMHAVLVFIAALGMTFYLVIVLIRRMMAWDSSNRTLDGL